MSYIRSTSNPEGLYIWGQEDGNCRFMVGPDIVGTMPTHVFNVLIDLYVDSHEEYTEFRDAKIEEVWTGDPMNGGEVKMRLSYGHKWHIDMWDATWYYIARSNYGRSKPRWKQKLMRRFDII